MDPHHEARFDRHWLASLFHPPATVTLLTGPSGSGKTTLCLRALAAARAAGLDVRGVLSLGRYDGPGMKTGIDLLDPVTGERWELASRTPPDPLTGRVWRFSATTLAHGAALLDASGACDLLIIDELGTLELQENKGWANAVAVLHARAYKRALVAVRQGLCATLAEQLDPLPVRILTLPSA